MRGSWHDKGIREYAISAQGPEIKAAFSNFEGIISGTPTRVAFDEKTELARIVKDVQSVSGENRGI